MSDYPERISISPTSRQKGEDDFFLVDRKAFPGKGTEYVRADRIEELEAKLAKAVELGLEECPFWDGSGAYNDWWHDRRTTLMELTGDNEVKGGKDE
jgi:hypothetical protein